MNQSPRGRPVGSPAVPTPYGTQTRERSISATEWGTVHILLPPSEGKSVPSGRRTLDLSTLSHDMLRPERERVLATLIALANGPEARARATLGISAKQVDELERDRTLLEQPVALAREVYSGVLYEALSLATLPAPVARRANSSILISSGLFGVVSPGDRIPAYRLSGDTDLPPLGRLASVWRDPLAEALTTTLRRGLVLDLRSSAYAAHFVPAGAVAERTVILRVLQERRIGRRTERVIVSHHNKATKGRLVRSLLLAGAAPRHAGEFIDTCRDLGFQADNAVVQRSGATTLDLVVAEL